LVLDLARDYRVDGIIGETFLGCDPWGGEVFMLRSELKDAGIPFISYEREFVPSLEGQIKTRVEAFLEMMGKGM
jgi:benzoyl-CoA reductase/2-hydroxyglutaryl-CoA dehydratase subunit BcrC/BadD/HgdB